MFMHSVHEPVAGGEVWVTMSLVRRSSAGLMTVKRQVSARFSPDGDYCAVSGAAERDPSLKDEASLNKAQVSAFIQMVVREGGAEHRDAFIDRGRFVSHTPGSCCRPEGLDALVARRRPRPGLVYHGVDDIVGEGAYVAVFSCFDLDGESFRACDLMRLEAGRIVEHWDVVEAVAAHSVAHNDET
ncbi:ester cyclase [Maricaulis maris]|nr:ester cyclase [Maricaulis maris]